MPAHHGRLEASLYYAVRTDAPGRPLSSTITRHRRPRPAEGTNLRDPSSEELESDALNTVLSTREWRTGRQLYRRVMAAVRMGYRGYSTISPQCLRLPAIRALPGSQIGTVGPAAQPRLSLKPETFMDAFHARQPNDAENYEVLQHTR